MDLPGRFSNTRPALRTLISLVLTRSGGRRPRTQASERHDTRGPVAKSRVQSQTQLRSARQAELIADYEEGVPVKAISAKYGVHRGTIPALVRRSGVAVRVPGLDAEDHTRALSLYESGMTLVQVARHMGIGDDAVRRAVLIQGGQIRPVVDGRDLRHRRPRLGLAQTVARLGMSNEGVRSAVAARDGTIRRVGPRAAFASL